MVRFLLNNQPVETNLPPATTLLDFVRVEANLCGTKIGCREGDCGACTVLLGTLSNQKLTYKSVTSCLTPLANVHGRHVVTIEGLNLDEPGPVQQAFIHHSGTQCGFCTPGFIVSLSGYALRAGEQPTIAEAIGSMDGNICRCTGYKSIERATKEVVQKLRENRACHTIEGLVKEGFLPGYFTQVAEKLACMPPAETPAGKLPLGGATDWYVQHDPAVDSTGFRFLANNQVSTPVAITNGECIVHRSATMADFMHFAPLQKAIPHWIDYLKLVASTPIRNMATLAGNLANASPIGDISIMLLALQAKITLEDPTGNHRSVFLHDFFKGYKVVDKASDEIIADITFRLPGTYNLFHFEKVCKRTYLDIASVNTAIKLVMGANETIQSAHLAMGGVAPVPLYLRQTSSLLSGKKVSAALVLEAANCLSNEIAPISDARGSTAYKRLLARQLFFSHFLHHFPGSIKMHDLL